MKKKTLTTAEKKRCSWKKKKASISATEQVKYNSTMKKQALTPAERKLGKLKEGKEIQL